MNLIQNKLFVEINCETSGFKCQVFLSLGCFFPASYAYRAKSGRGSPGNETSVFYNHTLAHSTVTNLVFMNNS